MNIVMRLTNIVLGLRTNKPNTFHYPFIADTLDATGFNLEEKNASRWPFIKQLLARV